MSASVGLLITGDEVLSGRTKDTNGPFLGMRLRENGVPVTQIVFCGDDPIELGRSLAFLAERVDTIIMTGGLGPTADDLTAEVVARAFGLELEFNQEAWEACVSYFKSLGRTEVPEANRKQALLPHGCALLPNPHGTATGFKVTGRLKDPGPTATPSSGRNLTLAALPGVPWEMESMFTAHVLPELARGQDLADSCGWQVFQLGESALQELVSPFEDRLLHDCGAGKVRLFYQAHPGWVTYSVRVTGAALSAPLRTDFIPAVDAALGKHLLAKEEAPLVEILRARLAGAGATLSLAESCTGGLLARQLTQSPGASATFAGGAVVYSNASKEKILGVPQALIAEHGATSVECALALALGAREAFQSGVALSITGVAGPSGGTERAPVGSVSFAIAVADKLLSPEAQSRLEAFRWKDVDPSQLPAQTRAFQVNLKFGARLSREAIQLRSAGFALGSLVALTQGLQKA